MTNNILKTAFLSLAVSLGGMAVSSTTATAGNIQVDFSFGGSGLYLSGGSRRHRSPGYGHGNRGSYGSDYGYRRMCSPRRAIRKARRIGVRDARIVRIRHRAIVVKGYRWGYPTRVKFGRSGRCPVVAIRSL